MPTLMKHTWETGSHYDEVDETQYEPLDPDMEWRIFDSFSYSPQGIVCVERKADNSLQTPVYEVFNGVKWAFDWPNNSQRVTWCVVNDEPCRQAYVLKLSDYNDRNGRPIGAVYYQLGEYDRGHAYIFKTQKELLDVVVKLTNENELAPVDGFNPEMISIQISEYEYKNQKTLFNSMLAGKGLQ